MKMQLDAEQQYVHPDPLNTGRFNLIGRPQSFIYAFSGYQTSDRQLAENLTKWIDLYHQDHAALQMKSLPSVIATQGCFAWRNTVPFTIRSRVLMGVGIDHAPLRLIFLQLMHALNRRLQNTSDGYGIKSNIAPYLAQFEPPAFSEMVGTALNPSDEKPAPIHKPEPGPEAADKQTPAAVQAFAAATKNLATEKSASMAERIASVSQPAAPSRAWANTLETRGDKGADAGQTADETQHEALDQQKRSSSTAAVSSVNATPAEGTDDSPGSAIPETPAEQQAHLAEMQARPGPVDTESNDDPVIKDLSIPQPRQIDTTSMQPPQNASRTRPTSPLSLFNDGTEGDAEEYKFNPIEPPVPQSNVDDDRASTSEDDRFLSTQKMEATKSDDVGTEGDVSKGVKPSGPSSAQDKETDEEDSFIDTLVETAESLAEDTSKPAPRKPQYVTESLI